MQGMKSKQSCLNVIFDISEQGRKGHFLNFQSEVIESFQSAKKEVSLCKTMSDLLSKIAGSIDFEKIHIFILWAEDVEISDFELLFDHVADKPIDVSIIVNSTPVTSNSKNILDSLMFFKKSVKSRIKLTLYSWDYRHSIDQNSIINWLPDYHKIVPRDIYPNKLTVGFYGNLVAHRGLNDFLILAALNPGIRFKIRGYGFNYLRFWRTNRFMDFKSTPFQAIAGFFVSFVFCAIMKLPNVDLKLMNFESAEEMSLDMQTCTSVFLASDKFEFPSGVAMQSLKSFVPVSWIGGNTASCAEMGNYFPSGKLSRQGLFKFNEFTKKLLNLRNADFQIMQKYPDLKTVITSCSC
jgi:hypothetical protein